MTERYLKSIYQFVKWQCFNPTFSILGKKYCSASKFSRGVVLDEYHLLSDY